MEKEKSEKKSENAGASSKPSSSVKGTPKYLKPKPKIVKNTPTKNSKKTKKGNSTPHFKGKKGKNKKIEIQGNKKIRNNAGEDAGKLKLEENEQKNNTDEKHIGKDRQSRKNKEKLGRSERRQPSQKNREKHGGLDRSLQNEKNKEKQPERSLDNEKQRDKLGGLIFMCSTKTKPDCFRYRVMGVSMGKKDIVLGVKPGLKLFLYDFDLRLMYGIYKASSSGGMKLEPAAFGRAFPVQVRFDVHKDCYPLPESVFKKAIKENYDERRKFKTELTVQQVKKLIDLFRPAEVHSNALHIQTPSVETVRDREMYEGGRANGERLVRDRHVDGDTRNYAGQLHEPEQRAVHRQVAHRGNEELRRDTFLTEKEYRAYGLQGQRRNLTPPGHVVSDLEPFQINYERDHLLGHRAPVYLDSAPTQIGSVQRGASYADLHLKDPYDTYNHGASYADPYLQPLRREVVLSGSYSLGARREIYLGEPDHLQRQPTDQVERSYSTYAFSALSEYKQGRQHLGTRPEPTFAPVSSRYSFAGPSSSYR